MAEKIYPQGLRTFAKHPNQPDFVLGTLVITLDDLKEWVEGEGKQYLTEYNGKKQIRLQILQGKDKVNLQVDTYKKGEVSGNGFTTRNGLTTKDDSSLPF